MRHWEAPVNHQLLLLLSLLWTVQERGAVARAHHLWRRRALDGEGGREGGTLSGFPGALES